MNLETIIKENYFLDLISLEKNNDSSDGNVYNVETLNNKFIVKLYDDLNKVNSLILLHNCLDDMHIPKIIKANNGSYFVEYCDKYIVIFSFLEGKQISLILEENNGVYLEDDVCLLAKEVRKLHDLTSGKNF